MLRIYKDKDIIRIRLDEYDYRWFIGELSDDNEYYVRHYYGVVPLYLNELTITNILFDNSVIGVLKKCVKQYVGLPGESGEIIDKIKELLKDLEVD